MQSKLEDAKVVPNVEVDLVENVLHSAPNGLADHMPEELTPEDAKVERRVLLKVDLIILPLLTVMYFLASLDRGDIANAAIAGMDKELHITPSQLSTCVSIFFVGYIVSLGRRLCCHLPKMTTSEY